MLFTRVIASRVQKHLFKGKVVVLYGPRRVGKTTLVRLLADQYEGLGTYLNCDEPDVRRALTDKTSSELKSFLGDKKLVIIDEAQRVRDIGLTLKLIVDNYPETQIVATGSSSFDLSNRISEPLTGRVYEFFLPPLALHEIYTDSLEAKRLLENRLIFGSYPEVVTHPSDAKERINLIYKNYLYKDALEYQRIKNSDLLERLLQALALQIGQEVSLTELANLLAIDQKTVASYIRILELAFIIFKLLPLSRNLRSEIKKSRKIYFWDTGIRNSVINNFNPLNLRSDSGNLWENFVVSERFKRNSILGKTPNCYFWRTKTQQEIDYIEEEDGMLRGFEIKASSGKKVRPPKQWCLSYANSTWSLVDRESFWEFMELKKS